MLGLTFSSKLNWSPHIISIAKSMFKNIGTWVGAPNCYLEIIDKLQKRICRTFGLSVTASLQPLAHRQNVASISLFYRHYFGRCSSKLPQLVALPYSRRRCTGYSDRLRDFSVIIPRCYKDLHVNSFFPRTARLWDFKWL